MDPGQLEQVILNLVVNARDAMPQGGKLTIETVHVELDERDVCRYAGLNPGSHVRLTVSDTGCGMDASTRARLFEPFFTTKPRGKGTGLGLAIVYGIITQSGGHIEVESSPGRGTLFSIYLPQVEMPVVSERTSIPSTRLLEGQETVLLVEGEEEVRTAIFESLQMRGYTVLKARNGREALMICRRHPGPIHLLLTDVGMPQMMGPELAQRLALSHPDLKVLYMSGYTSDALGERNVAGPGTAFLQKPFTPGALARAVREVLETASPSPPPQVRS
jgi:two-component system cell cycle sensor histidine kinase/response regulator CckA